MDKKTTSPRGRIMQVVEVEEDNASAQQVDVPVPSEIVKDEVSAESEIQPDIASSFPVPQETVKDESTSPVKVETNTGVTQDIQKDIPPLKTEEKRDIVSELFETKKENVQYPDISLDRKPSRFGFIVWIILLFAIVGAIGGGLVFWKSRSTNEPVSSVGVTSTPTSVVIETETPIPSSSSASKKTPTPTKTASVSATPKKTGLSIQVLNGSGVKGVASSMQKYLEEKGYTVFGTGNAKNFEYAQTEIIIKADKASLLEKLKTDLSGSYTVGSTSATLDPSVSYDAQVIIGAE